MKISQTLLAETARVKSVDFHSTQPWIAVSLITGHLNLWDYRLKVLLKSVQVASVAVRCAKFVEREGWVIVGTDGGEMVVFDEKSLEERHRFKAHSDYLRGLSVHPTRTEVLSCADDGLLKIWDWSTNWTQTQTFQGHSHYVLSCSFNPYQPNSFASGSLDTTIKVWDSSSQEMHNLVGHDKGINSVQYLKIDNKVLIVSGSDDGKIKFWDAATKICIQTLDAHSNNISFVIQLNNKDIIVSGSEDHQIAFWNSAGECLSKVDCQLERAWCVATFQSFLGEDLVCVGFDKGLVLFQNLDLPSKF